MKGLDTNVLVRYIVRDDAKQAEKASACIQNTISKGGKCFINSIVLCELVWVLEAAYHLGKTEIVAVLEKMLMTRQFEIEKKDLVRQAVNAYGAAKGDFADYLIGGINHMHGCTRTATFDRSLKGIPIFELLE